MGVKAYITPEREIHLHWAVALHFTLPIKAYIPLGFFLSRWGKQCNFALGTFQIIFTLMKIISRKCLHNHDTGPILYLIFIKKSYRIYM